MNIYIPDLIPSDNNVNQKKELCDIAQKDAWHDHHSIKGLTKTDIKSGVNGYIPSPTTCGIHNDDGDEDRFMGLKLLEDPRNIALCKPSDKTIIEGYCKDLDDDIYQLENTSQYFTNWVDERYKVLYCFNQGETGQGGQGSIIQKALNKMGITQDYFFIKDTGYSSYAKDIRQTIPGEGKQKITTLLTSAGIYDPGPTNTPFTDTGVEQGFKDNLNSKFGILDFSSLQETVTEYPAWINSTTDLDKYSPSEKLLYSKYNCKMIVTTDNTSVKSQIKLANSTLYIEDVDDAEKSTIYYIDKTNSDKATSVSELVLKETYATSFKCGLFGKVALPPEYKGHRIVSSSGAKKYFSKKVGDQGQALQCLRSEINYLEYDHSSGLLNSKKSNGVHGFVSIDRCAVVAAIYYGVPIIIFNTKNGFVIYVSEKLVNQSYLKELEDKQELVDKKKIQLIVLKETLLSEMKEETFDSVSTIIESFITSFNSWNQSFNSVIIDTTQRLSRTSATLDTEYKLWLSKLYIWYQLAKLIETSFVSIQGYENLDLKPLFTQYRNTIEESTQALIDLSVDYNLDTIKAAAVYLDKNSEPDETSHAMEVEYLSDFEKGLERISTYIERLDQSLTILEDIKKKISIMEQIIKINENILSIIKMDINTFGSTEDEKIIIQIVKKLNKGMSVAISDVTTAQTIINPNAIINLLSCFGSGKKVFSIGPLYLIIEHYQYQYFWDIIKNTLTIFFSNCSKLSINANTKLQFNARLSQMNDQLENAINYKTNDTDKNTVDNALLGLKNNVCNDLKVLYTTAIDIVIGGKSEKYDKNIQKLKKYTGGIKPDKEYIQNYLEFISLLSIETLRSTDTPSIDLFNTDNKFLIEEVFKKYIQSENFQKKFFHESIQFFIDCINFNNNISYFPLYLELYNLLFLLNSFFKGEKEEDLIKYFNVLVDIIKINREKNLKTLLQENNDDIIESRFDLLEYNIIGYYNNLYLRYLKLYMFIQRERGFDQDVDHDVDHSLIEEFVKINKYNENIQEQEQEQEQEEDSIHVLVIVLNDIIEKINTNSNFKKNISNGIISVITLQFYSENVIDQVKKDSKIKYSKLYSKYLAKSSSNQRLLKTSSNQGLSITSSKSVAKSSSKSVAKSSSKSVAKPLAKTPLNTTLQYVKVYNNKSKFFFIFFVDM